MAKKASAALLFASMQRIQSLFFLLAAAAKGSLFFGFGLAHSEKESETGIFADSVFNVSDSLALLILSPLTALLSLALIFFALHRHLQIQLSFIAIVLSFAFLALSINSILGESDYSLGIGFFMPLLAVVFLFLAVWGIRKDEKIVKSMDRLR